MEPSNTGEAKNAPPLSAFGDAHQGFVVEVDEFVNERRVLEDALDLLADEVGTVVLGEQFGHLLTELLAGPTEVRLEDLSDVHTRRHAERIEDDLHRRSILEVRHVLFGQDARDDALVTVTSGHLVADARVCASWRCKPSPA